MDEYIDYPISIDCFPELSKQKFSYVIMFGDYFSPFTTIPNVNLSTIKHNIVQMHLSLPFKVFPGLRMGLWRVIMRDSKQVLRRLGDEKIVVSFSAFSNSCFITY